VGSGGFWWLCQIVVDAVGFGSDGSSGSDGLWRRWQ
jgi:hypothetical protein